MAGRSAPVAGIARTPRPVCDGRGSGRAERAGGAAGAAGAAGADFNCWRWQPGS